MEPARVELGLPGRGDEFVRLEPGPIRDWRRPTCPDGFGLAILLDALGPATVEWKPPTAVADLLDCMLRCEGETERVDELGFCCTSAVADLLVCMPRWDGESDRIGEFGFCCAGADVRDTRTGVLVAPCEVLDLPEGKGDKPTEVSARGIDSGSSSRSRRSTLSLQASSRSAASSASTRLRRDCSTKRFASTHPSCST